MWPRIRLLMQPNVSPIRPSVEAFVLGEAIRSLSQFPQMRFNIVMSFSRPTSRGSSRVNYLAQSLVCMGCSNDARRDIWR